MTGNIAIPQRRTGFERWHEVSDWVSANSLDLGLAAVVAILIALALITLRSIGRRIVRKSGGRRDWRTIIAHAVSRTSLFFILMCAAKLVTGQAAAPPPVIGRTVDILFIIAAAFQAAVWGRELILGFVQHRVGTEDDHSRLGSAISLIRLLVTVALFAIAIVVILDNIGVNVTGLVAGLGIGGIAIGLAAQGIFSDLFAALSIIFDRPFRRGDTITFGLPPTTGTVEQIGLKSTRIRSLNGEQVVIANRKLLEQQLQNWALLERRRSLMTFGVAYHLSAELLARIPLELKELVEAQPLATFDRAHTLQFTPNSIDFEMVFFVESSAYADFVATRQAVMLRMVRRFQELGIEFAYPRQASFTAAPDGQLIMPYPPAAPAADAG
jgi:small-conductance mechanosensitive channel